MRILHLSDTGLPDRRIEKAAMSSSGRSYDVFFAGNAEQARSNVFKQVFPLPWTRSSRLALPPAWERLKKSFRRILDSVKPDIIHAHNLFAAKLASEFDVPLVFDDHEYMSMRVKALTETLKNKSVRKKSSLWLANRKWPKWERVLIESVPTIVASDVVAQEYKSKGSRVFVVPNYPNKDEVKEFSSVKTIDSKLSSVYVGFDSETEPLPHRNIVGFTNLFFLHDIGNLTMIGAKGISRLPVNYTGPLIRRDMYQEMSKHHIGIIPWRKHWLHKYSNPNKAFEYVHSGLFVLTVGTLDYVTTNLREHCIAFDDYDELIKHLSYIKEHIDVVNKKRIASLRYAREYLLWERYEQNIFESYKIA